MRVRASAASGACPGLAPGLAAASCLRVPSPVSSTRVASSPGRSVEQQRLAARVRRNRRAPAASSAARRRPHRRCAPRRRARPPRTRRRTRQSTCSVARPLVQTPNSIAYPLAVEARARLIYLIRSASAPLRADAAPAAQRTGASDGKCNPRARRFSGGQAAGRVGEDPRTLRSARSRDRPGWW